MSTRISVHKETPLAYDIVMESSFHVLCEELRTLGFCGRRFCIVSDSTVASFYLDEVRDLLTPIAHTVTSYVFPAGEESKTLSTVQKLYEHLILHTFDRNDILIALGGGVVGDLTGFAAATYLRGIAFVQVPTTLLSQVDSSIGGKTGVDFDSYKNMVGAFHNPKLVYMNLATLSTLTERQYLSGMGEIVKHGLIKDAGYYEWLCTHTEEILARDLAVCEEMITKSCHIKRIVVENDRTEKGERALLNFGHTLGHAIEKEMQFSLLHGECVSLGSLAAAYLSAKRGLISMEEVSKLRSLLSDLQLPVTVSGLSSEALLNAVKHDKKMEQGSIKFILLKNIGQAYIDKSVTDCQMKDALEYLYEK